MTHVKGWMVGTGGWVWDAVGAVGCAAGLSEQTSDGVRELSRGVVSFGWSRWAD